MRVKILLEQEARRDMPERGYLASGEVADVDKAWALELLGRGEAEPAGQSPAQASRKAVAIDAETR